MIKKCVGCGIELQDNNSLIEGYTQDLRNDLCRRCFRMRNYGEYEFVTKSNDEYIKILKNIGNQKCLVLFLVDLMSIPKDLNKVREYVKDNEIILVLNKRDVLPLSINDEKIFNYFYEQYLGFSDIILISANKNYNLDLLMNKINEYRKYDDVYVIGNTNAGKSTLINKIIKNYAFENQEEITISPMPSTTLNEIKIRVNNFNLIDTPGLVDNGNILNYVKENKVKKISPKKEIKTRTYQLKPDQSLIIDDLVRIDYTVGYKNSFTLFISNDLEVKRINSKRNGELTDLDKETVIINRNQDLVINGLGFIKIISPGKVTIYKNKDLEVFTRKSLI